MEPSFTAVRLPVTATAVPGMLRAGSLERPVTWNQTGMLCEREAESPRRVPWRESTRRLGLTFTYVAPASGIAATEARDWSLAPATFVAMTLNVYEVLLVSPAIVQERAPVVWHAFAPGVETTSYAHTGLPPSKGGAPHEITAEALEATAVTFTGASGRVRGVTAAEAIDSRPMPSEFVAVTVKV